MPSFLVESYAPNASRELEESSARAQRAAELGVGVRYVRTTFLPDDETILHLFDAPSVEAVDRAGRLAELRFDRIVEAVDATQGDKGGSS